jgi:CNT family concentrative nucleoside transporter
MERILGWLFYPFALVSGVPFSDVVHLGELYGQKTILNEFYAYTQLLDKIQDPAVELSTRSIVIASYGLCGFANLSSIAIQIGGIGGIAPNRRSDLAKIGIRAMIAGTLAAWMTGNVVGIFM